MPVQVQPPTDPGFTVTARPESKLERSTERHEPLRAWLDRNNAVFAWGTTKSAYTPELKCWLVKGVPVIVTFFDKGGWNLFVPSAPHSNRIDTSLDHAAVAIGNGCLGCRDLVPDGDTKGG